MVAFRKGSFPAGHIPWNKGTKGLVKSNKGSFKNGQHSSPKTEFQKGHHWDPITEKNRIESSRLETLKKPDLTSTENLAYLLGLLMGDGFVISNKTTKAAIIGFQSTDEKLSLNFLECLSKIGLHAKIFKVKPHNKVSKSDAFSVVSYSKNFVNWYRNLTLENLKTLLDSRDKIISFLKGFYEAEGHSHISKRGQLTVAFTNTDLNLQKLVQALLLNLGFDFRLNGPYWTGRVNEKPYYNVRTSKKLQSLSFLKLIKPSVKKGNFDVYKQY